eukprot:TRINITY_DN1835_c0_g1_i2.p1 TRINITY_DN1835_c0_g1~~TRINITY_DN1835_c0_g1_i2.p1  ORF type:complete len:165 (-),score=20.83 TRINITY_DN1835_c0_g1_i2:100-594(-)
MCIRDRVGEMQSGSETPVRASTPPVRRKRSPKRSAPPSPEIVPSPPAALDQRSPDLKSYSTHQESPTTPEHLAPSALFPDVEDTRKHMLMCLHRLSEVIPTHFDCSRSCEHCIARVPKLKFAQFSDAHWEALGRLLDDEVMAGFQLCLRAVSYTHLTLPTKRIV